MTAIIISYVRERENRSHIEKKKSNQPYNNNNNCRDLKIQQLWQENSQEAIQDISAELQEIMRKKLM